MYSGFSKGLEGTLKAGIMWRMALVCVVICGLGIVSSDRYSDDLIRKMVGDRATIDHAQILTEADLVVKLEELLGTLALHQKLVGLEGQIADETTGLDADIERSSREILGQVSARLIRQYHVFRSTLEQLPKGTDLFTHFLPQYDDIQSRLITDLESIEAAVLAVARKSPGQDAAGQHDLIRDTLSRYQLIIFQVSNRARFALDRTINLSADHLLFLVPDYQY